MFRIDQQFVDTFIDSYPREPEVITTILKPGRRNKQSDVAYIREHWPNTIIIVRGDSHFIFNDFMEWCDGQPEIGLITGLSGNKKLHELASVTY